MVDAVDSKSTEGNFVGVQISPPAPFIYIKINSGEGLFMPNKKSAERRVRISERNRLYNKHWSSRCKTAVKNLFAAVESGNNEEAVKNFNLAQSVIDKAVVKGVMHKNTAARRKELMSRKIKTLSI